MSIRQRKSGRALHHTRAPIIVVRERGESACAVTDERRTMHECQRSRLKRGEPADGRTHGWTERRVLEQVFSRDGRANHVIMGQRLVVAKLREKGVPVVSS